MGSQLSVTAGATSARRLGLPRAAYGASDYETCSHAMRQICGPYRLESERWWDFRGSIENFTAASLNVTDIRLSDGKVIRDSRGEERYRGDFYYLVLQVDGVARMCQRGAEALLKPGDCTLIDSRLASVFHIGSGTRQYSFNFPAEVIHTRFGRDSSLICRRISGAVGAGAVLADALRSIVRHAQTSLGADLTDVMVQLLSAATGSPRQAMPDAQIERPPICARDLTEYVDANVHKLLLTPRDVAKHFNVSLRQLYRIAASANCTPSALIWQRRLSRARELLANSAHMPITEIAYSCGFKDGAHFSRSYRKAFGQTPRLARRTSAADSTAMPDTG